VLEKAKIINVSKARKNLSKLISRIGQGEEAIVVAHYRKPKVALVNYNWLQLIVRKLEAYEKENKTAQWKLAGSMKLAEKIDVDAAIKKIRQQANKALKQGAVKLNRTPSLGGFGRSARDRLC
jgi:PHD/YefM family antitoxin component YafN of YafNO toxin-antitoxin module